MQIADRFTYEFSIRLRLTRAGALKSVPLLYAFSYYRRNGVAGGHELHLNESLDFPFLINYAVSAGCKEPKTQQHFVKSERSSLVPNEPHMYTCHAHENFLIDSKFMKIKYFH